MAYNYKREAFREWYRKNEDRILRKELKEVLGTSSSNSLQYWLLEKELPPLKPRQTDTGDRDWLPLRCILRLCNHYPDLRLSDFIEDAEEPAVARSGLSVAETVMQLRIELAETRAKLAEMRADKAEIENAVRQTYLLREDEIRRGYEKKIQSLIDRLPKVAARESVTMTTTDERPAVEGEKG